jgi:ribulose-phosphate 3-epimerase
MAKIVPAILTDDKKIFRERLQIASQLTDRIQVDVIDQKFMPHLGICPGQIIKKYAQRLSLEAHLMIEKPEDKLKYYQSLCFKKLIPHYSALRDPERYLSQKAVSIALNQAIDLKKIKAYLANIETVQVMGVVPGKMGQAFIPETLDKIRQLRGFGDKIEIEVDGGVNSSNIRQIIQAGADVVVCGSAIFGQGNPEENYQSLISNIK